MGVRTVAVGSGQKRRPGFPGAPTGELLIAPGGEDPVAVVHVEVPPGGNLPEHSHGASHTLVIGVAGEVVLIDGQDGEESEPVGPGAVASVAVGQRVRLENRTPEPARLLLLFTPPDFAEHIASWPALA